MWIVTVKFSPDKRHDPFNKKSGVCRTSLFCTDKTGAHHSILVDINTTSTKKVAEYVRANLGDVHITRIEMAKILYEKL